MKSFFIVLLQTCLVMVLLAQVAGATEIDRLVRELVKNGVIDPATAQEVLTLTKQDIKKDLARGKVETLPKWVQVINMKGDFRFRNQWEEKQGSDPRFRDRIRFRLGGEAQVSPGWKVGFGLTTGGTDPRSTNQTLGEVFETKNIMLDYAYGKYIAPKYLTVTAGKFANKLGFWTPSDLLWDCDIAVEGTAVRLAKESLFVNSGYYILDENKADIDPLLLVLQPGLNLNLHEKYNVNLAAEVYRFNDMRGTLPAHSAETNSYTVDTTGAFTGLIYDYKTIGFSGSLGMTDVIFPYLGIFAETIVNNDVSKDNGGYLIGFAFGARKVVYRKDWQIKYNYRHLGKDAWPDFLPDSDTYGGATGIQGHELVLQYGLSKNVNLALDYYNISKINGSATPQDLVQIDFNLKF